MLNIDSKYQFLFIHIPKCAGTSIEKLFGYDYDTKNYFENNFDYGYAKHYSLSDYEKILNSEILNKLFKFTIIRNPFDLVVSNYNFCMNNNNIMWNGRNDYEYKKTISFKSYIKYIDTIKTITPQNRLNIISIDYWIETNKIKLDFIGRFENLQNDFKIISKQLNINNDFKLPFSNKSKINNINYQDYYDNETKDLVYKMFKNELKKYNYEF